ncbi:MAG TPA: tetratricopeptide repeat protein [Pyrinomonadaceae bacterium]|nr:tetratricopeptide repeat protein [Pyrinomonadaceae bacterium]
MKALVVDQFEGPQVICWDRGRPARNAPKVRRFYASPSLKTFSRCALIAGGAPAVPANHLRAFGLIAVVFICANVGLAQRGTNKVAGPSSSSLVITTEPNALIWIDEIRRGVTDSAGRIELKTSAGRHTLRVRAMGFKEAIVSLVAGRRSMAVKLVRTTDQAELTFQQAEDAREKARDDEARQKAAELYRAALKLRPANAAAHVGLARVLLDLNQHETALAEIDAARRVRPIYAEASAVEGRINREAAFTDDAIQSFRRAIREAPRGLQPEAHVGLARVFEDKGQYDQAIVEFRKAIDQLSDSEPVIYQLLGAAYEKQQKYKEAVAAYEKYLALAPNGSLAPAIRSIIDQLKRDAAGQEIIP